MARVRLLTFARVVSVCLCTSMVLESPAKASPYAGSLRLVGLAPAGEVLGVPVPGQTPPPAPVNPASQNFQGAGESAPSPSQVVAPTGGPWMQPQIQVLVQPQIQVQANPQGNASPRADAAVHVDTASEGTTSATVQTGVETSSAVETVAQPRVETPTVATNCPVVPASQPAPPIVAPPPAPEQVPPAASYAELKKPGQLRLAAGVMMLTWTAFGVGALAGMHAAKCSKGEKKHCDRELGLVAIPVVGPLMTAREAGELAPVHVIVGVMQGAGVLLLIAGATRLARARRLSQDGIRVGKNTAIRAGSGLTLTTRF